MRIGNLPGFVSLFVVVLACPVSAQEVIWTFDEGWGEGGFGTSTAIDADVDGDGLTDILVGVPDRYVAVKKCGAVFAYSGKTGSKIGDVTYDVTRSSYFGVRVCGLQDIDGDGCDEMVGSSTVDGVVVVFSGKAGAALTTIGPAGAEFGRVLAAGGDHDGDGKRDLIIGDQYGVGVYSSVTGGRIFDLVPSGTKVEYGAAAADAGDVDADGYDDVIVGDPNGGPYDPANCSCNNSGNVYVFSGKDGTELFKIQPSNAPYRDFSLCKTYSTPFGGGWKYCFPGGYRRPEFGIAVDGAGDVDGDGHADFIVGRPGRTNGIPVTVDVGHAYVYSGATQTVLLDLIDISGYPQSDLGDRVAGCGDVDGDGKPDILTHDPYSNSPNGLIALFSGLNGVRMFGRETKFRGAFEHLGGDVDGDGRNDFPIVLEDPSQTDHVLVIRGTELFVDFKLHEVDSSKFFFELVSSAPSTSSKLVLLAITEVLGSPVFIPAALGNFSGLGIYQRNFACPGGLLPLGSYGIQAFTTDSNGNLLASPIDRVELH